VVSTACSRPRPPFSGHRRYFLVGMGTGRPSANTGTTMLYGQMFFHIGNFGSDRYRLSIFRQTRTDVIFSRLRHYNIIALVNTKCEFRNSLGVGRPRQLPSDLSFPGQPGRRDSRRLFFQLNATSPMPDDFRVCFPSGCLCICIINYYLLLIPADDLGGLCSATIRAT